MRIDAINRVSQLYQANSTKKVAKSNNAEKYDSVQISQMGKDYQVAKAAVAATPDVRTDLARYASTASVWCTFVAKSRALLEP